MKRTMLILIAVSCTLALGCGSSTPTKTPTSKPVPPAAKPSPFDYAASPITAFADEVTAIALAAMHGKTLPKGSFPLWVTTAPGKTEIVKNGTRRSTSFTRRGNEIVQTVTEKRDGKIIDTKTTVVGHVNKGKVDEHKLKLPVTPAAFFLRVRAVLTVSREQKDQGRYLDTTLMLTKHGLKVLTYKVEKDDAFGFPMPPTLSRLDKAVVPILDALRAGNKPANVLSDREIQSLGKDMSHQIPAVGPGQLVANKTALSAVSGKAPSGYMIERIYVLVVDSASKLAYLKLSAGRSETTFSLSRDPIVSVYEALSFE